MRAQKRERAVERRASPAALRKPALREQLLKQLELSRRRLGTEPARARGEVVGEPAGSVPRP